MADLARRLGDMLGVEVLEMQPLHGGDISSVYSVRLAGGRRVIAKRGGPCETEARMLDAIRKTGCPAPQVLGVAQDLLVLSHLDEGLGTPTGWAAAGWGVATLHADCGSFYGWSEDTRFGEAPCPAAPCDHWPEFWASRRLLAWPDSLPTDIARRLDRVAGRLDTLLPHRPHPSLLHGDLWRGNVLLHEDRCSGLIDPACYYGDAEVDLAMMALFAHPPETFWSAYGPLPHGWKQRRVIYQLWPALVHLRLFGSGYLPMVDRLLQSAENPDRPETT